MKESECESGNASSFYGYAYPRMRCIARLMADCVCRERKKKTGDDGLLMEMYAAGVDRLCGRCPRVPFFDDVRDFFLCPQRLLTDDVEDFFSRLGEGLDGPSEGDAEWEVFSDILYEGACEMFGRECEPEHMETVAFYEREGERMTGLRRCLDRIIEDHDHDPLYFRLACAVERDREACDEVLARLDVVDAIRAMGAAVPGDEEYFASVREEAEGRKRRLDESHAREVKSLIEEIRIDEDPTFRKETRS